MSYAACSSERQTSLFAAISSSIYFDTTPGSVTLTACCAYTGVVDSCSAGRPTWKPCSSPCSIYLAKSWSGWLARLCHHASILTGVDTCFNSSSSCLSLNGLPKLRCVWMLCHCYLHFLFTCTDVHIPPVTDVARVARLCMYLLC